MMNIKPIETHYKGYRFRSRLEARWAVFFDNANINYQYEPQGYQLEDVLYLPDFFLPDFDVFFEVKGPGINIVDSHKAYQLCRFTQKTILIGGDIFNGDIDHLFPIKLVRYFFLDYDKFVGVRNVFDGTFVECNQCHSIFPAAKDIFLASPNFIEDCTCKCEHPASNQITQTGDGIYRAYLSGRQARFEHGEKG